MAHQANNAQLYQQALSAALDELHTLSVQRDRLQHELDRLERQKAAVEAICDAIGQWIETREAEDAPEASFEAFTTAGSVGLTEEEISLIAYPIKLPKEA